MKKLLEFGPEKPDLRGVRPGTRFAIAAGALSCLIKTRQVRELGELGRRRMQGQRYSNGGAPAPSLP
jgi:hypothetical protein